MPMSAVLENTAKTKNQKQWLAGLVTSVMFLIVCLSWGTTWLGIKIAVESVPPLTSAGLRFLIAFPLFLCFAMVRREPILFPRESRWFFVFVTLSYFGVPYYLLNYGEMHVSSGLTAPGDNQARLPCLFGPSPARITVHLVSRRLPCRIPPKRNFARLAPAFN